MKFVPVAPALLGLALLGVASAAHGQQFSFAGVSFNQEAVFTKVEVLGDSAMLGNAHLSAGVPDILTGRVPFPAGTHENFDRSRSVGTLALGRADGPRAITLPKSRDGQSERHGIRLSYVARVGILNLSGPDVAIFESGDTMDGPEAFALRARNAVTGEWSRWFYEASTNYQPYRTGGNSGAYSTLFDFSEVGMETGDLVDAIEIVNLTRADGIEVETTRGSGRVHFNGDGGLPNPNSEIIKDFKDVNGYDPDILYAVALRPLVNLPAPGAVDETK